MKSLYEFRIIDSVEKEVAETKEENGEKITTYSKVKEELPYSFFIKKPSRSEKEEAELIRVQYFSEYTKRGILTQAMLSKTYANYGGILSDEEVKHYAGLRVELYEKLRNFELISAQSSKEDAAEKLKEINELQSKLTRFEYEQGNFFNNTAEAKARNKLIEYLVLTLTYFKKESETEYKSFFSGETFEDKLKVLEKYEDENYQLYNLIRDRVAFATSLFVSMGGNIEKGDIEKYEKEIGVIEPEKK
jgi:hypothetical protein